MEVDFVGLENVLGRQNRYISLSLFRNIKISHILNNDINIHKLVLISTLSISDIGGIYKTFFLKIS